MKIKECEFNGKKVSIILTSFNDGEFNFFALDEKRKIVAKCSFDIINTYIRKNASSSTSAPKSNSTALQSASGKIEMKVGNLSSQQPHQEVIIKNGKIYLLQDTYCKLVSIEICDKRFYKVGLGSELFKLTEDFSIKQNCSKISAWVYPHGQFGNGTLKFYHRNDFSFSKDHLDHTIATKELKIKKQEIELRK